MSKRIPQLSSDEIVSRLHPDLKAHFVPLPQAGELLTPKQLTEIFGGDLKALRDVSRLAHQSDSDQTAT